MSTFSPPPSFRICGATRWLRQPPMTRIFLILSCLKKHQTKPGQLLKICTRFYKKKNINQIPPKRFICYKRMHMQCNQTGISQFSFLPVKKQLHAKFCLLLISFFIPIHLETIFLHWYSVNRYMSPFSVTTTVAPSLAAAIAMVTSLWCRAETCRGAVTHFSPLGSSK